jgi:hypothetical protein
MLIYISTDGRALIVNLHKKAVLHHFNFKERVYDLKYSPDGRSHSPFLSLLLILLLILFFDVSLAFVRNCLRVLEEVVP